MANGGDNIGTYIPLFATQAGWRMAVTCIVFGLMTLLWCVAAAWRVNHPAFGKVIRRYGHRLLPFVLVGLGAMILYEAGFMGLIVRLVSGS